MATHKDHTALFIGLAVIGGFIAYEWWKGQQAAQVDITDGATSAPAPTIITPTVGPARTATIQDTAQTNTGTTVPVYHPILSADGLKNILLRQNNL